MSKSLNQIFLPAFGGTALALSGALVFSNKDYASNQIDALESRVAQVEQSADAARQTAQAEAERAKAAIAQAEAEAERAATLEAKITEVQQAAATLAATQTAPVVQAASRAEPSKPAPASGLGLGRTALPEEIDAWDQDVLPDGRGLPEGSGDAFTGEEVFADKCASCHGDFAEGVDNWPVLAGGFDTLADEDPVKTVGSYWPHLSTAWDYIYRSMPFGEAGTLTPDETYAIVAYILYSNDLVDDEFVLSHENLASFEMHNAAGFVVDDRETLEYSAWRAEPCMEACKSSVQITKRATFVDVTPADGGESVMNDASATDTPVFKSAEPAVSAAPAQPAEEAASSAEDSAQDSTQEIAAVDPALIKAGEKVFKKCKACHTVGAGAKNKSGPQLNDLIGRTMGSVEGFKYSKGFKQANADGRVWDEAALAEFLTKPKAFMKGTKMSFSGLKKKGDQEAILAYLNSFRND